MNCGLSKIRLVHMYVYVYLGCFFVWHYNFNNIFYCAESSECQVHPNQKSEAIQASYTLLRGFLNAMDAYDNVCSNFFICEAAHQASKSGKIGKTLAKVASSNAQSWLLDADRSLHNGTEHAGLRGCDFNDCFEIFPCSRFHKTYKKPIPIL